MIRRTALAIALFTALPALAQIYSWKDSEGKVHYGDSPPPTGEVNVIRGAPAARPAPAPAPEPASAPGETDTAKAQEPSRPQTLAEREQAFRERRAAEAEAQAKAEEEAARDAERQRFCEQARNQLPPNWSGEEHLHLKECLGLDQPLA